MKERKIGKEISTKGSEELRRRWGEKLRRRRRRNFKEKEDGRIGLNRSESCRRREGGGGEEKN